jgi:DEAD/DEAH box helicase domain-containing protein
MIPLTIAEEIRTTILDYLATTFNFQDEEVEKALLDFLAPKPNGETQADGLFKGPYVSLRLPFRKADAGAEIPLEIRPNFLPYAHQLRSFERLSGREGRKPKPTLITTGTGSGKTECFLFPVLDYCYAHRGEAGIKAIILYPMNALATDQSARLARMIADDPRLKGQVSAGIYIGGEGEGRGSMSENQLIDDRDVLRKNPPDILLTNYKMLDFLLLRPEDKTLWAENTTETLRFLVLDELHTYDGAQGSDVACLIRRLKARLNIPEGFLCPIGTSATVASEQGDTRSLLTSYAEQIFDETFELDSVIVEDRLSLDEFIPNMPTRDSLPAEIELLAEVNGESYDDYIRRQTTAWFGAFLSAPELAQSLRSHAFLRAVLAQTSASILPLGELIEKLEKWDPTFAQFTHEQQSLLLQSFLALVAHARTQEGKDLRPFLTCQVQLWVREISRLMRELNAEPKFFWRDDVPLSSERRGLPAYFCRECGHSGWLTFMRDGDDYLTDDHRKVYNEYFSKTRHVRYVYPAPKNNEPNLDGFRVCGECLTVSNDEICKACNKGTIPVHIHFDLSTPSTPNQQANDMQRCPVCGTDGALSIVGSQAASLSSVAISHLYTSPLNQDKKLLAFTDSVQDASHRASFFEARTYRFNLRTALQAALPEDAPIRLDELTDRVISHWTSAWKGNKYLNQRVVATFMPPDLRDLQNYKQYMDLTEKSEGETVNAPIPSDLDHDLKQRLSWEVTMEYGFTARVGRSLEKVGSSVAYLDPALLDEVAEIIALRLPEEIGTVENVSKDAVRHFLQGLLERTRTRGGIVHPLLGHYAQEQGNWYLLTKKQQILMSPFHKNSPRFPRFLSDANGKVFDLFITAGNRRTWYVDWCQKTFGDKLQFAEINDLYRMTVSVLHEKGLLKKYPKANDNSYGIEPRHVWVTHQAVILKCDQCGNLHTVPASEKDEWLNHPCMAFRCSGHYSVIIPSAQHYYREIYRRGQVERIFAHEHTGLLSRPVREKVEKDFKTQTRADATNLLTATPTLELGIDIGDLSSTMACSVPPAPANYLQRIGRAGRKTGNSLILTLANAQPHDLYFFEEPLEMMAGVITPPGCYLDAPDMLKRQYLAYCMDTWTATHQRVTLLPHNVSKMLAGIKKGGFPENLITFIQDNRQSLMDGFMEIFGPQISKANRSRLLAYFASDESFAAIRTAIAEVETERDELRSARKALKTRRDKIEADPAQFQNPEKELKRIQQDMHLLLDMIKNIEEQYILNFFTDAGLLPNYAFPETGVKFEAVITGFDRKGDNAKNYEVKKYIRAAAVAIRELAPSNHFYAEGRKLTISHIDVAGREKSIEKWQFCDQCSHMELVQASHFSATCPVCGSSMWSDQGQQHDMVRFSKAMSYVDLHDSKVGDEGENRERAQFNTNHYFEMPPENSGDAIILPSLPFGFEYHDQVTLREINFAPKNLGGQNIPIAGEDQPLQGFKTCRDCGVTVETSRTQNQGQEGPKHTRNCASATTAQQIEWENIYLYRQVTSEAIRILLPVSTTLVDEKMATFEACLDLALRRKFKGSPDHLHILPHNEPTADGNRRRFLVIYDSVQGGTGFLKELAKPEVFFDMLQLALDSLTSCRCRLNPEKQACYRCLYSYRVKHDLKLISRALGAEMLSEILAQKDSRETVTSLSQIHIDSLIESELEQRFVYALGNYVKGKADLKFSPTMYNGKQAWDLRLGDTNWILEPQVHLGHTQNVRAASRADFVLWSRNTQSKPIAIFTDGFSYHVKPGQSLGGVADDIKKRRAIIDSGKFLVWSITWDDVKAFEDKNKELDWRLFTSSQISFLDQNLPVFRARPDGAILKQNAVGQLIQYLREPSEEIWAQVAALMVLSTLRPPRPPLDRAILQSKMDALCNSEIEVDLSMPDTSLADGNWYSVVLKGFTKLFSFMQPESIQSKRIEEFTIALRLNDFDVARNQPEFKEDWNRFWLLTNLLQFLPGFIPVSTEYIRLTADEIAPVQTPVQTVGDEWAQAFRFASPEISSLLQDCQSASLSAPIIGYELMDSTDRIAAIAEAAWEDKKIVILISDIEENRPAFEDLGWVTFSASDTSIALIETYRTR